MVLQVLQQDAVALDDGVELLGVLRTAQLVGQRVGDQVGGTRRSVLDGRLALDDGRSDTRHVVTHDGFEPGLQLLELVRREVGQLLDERRCLGSELLEFGRDARSERCADLDQVGRPVPLSCGDLLQLGEVGVEPGLGLQREVLDCLGGLFGAALGGPGCLLRRRLEGIERGTEASQRLDQLIELCLCVLGGEAEVFEVVSGELDLATRSDSALAGVVQRLAQKILDDDVGRSLIAVLRDGLLESFQEVLGLGRSLAGLVELRTRVDHDATLDLLLHDALELFDRSLKVFGRLLRVAQGLGEDVTDIDAGLVQLLQGSLVLDDAGLVQRSLRRVEQPCPGLLTDDGHVVFEDGVRFSDLAGLVFDDAEVVLGRLGTFVVALGLLPKLLHRASDQLDLSDARLGRVACSLRRTTVGVGDLVLGDGHLAVDLATFLGCLGVRLDGVAQRVQSTGLVQGGLVQLVARAGEEVHPADQAAQQQRSRTDGDAPRTEGEGHSPRGQARPCGRSGSRGHTRRSRVCRRAGEHHGRRHSSTGRGRLRRRNRERLVGRRSSGGRGGERRSGVGSCRSREGVGLVAVAGVDQGGVEGGVGHDSPARRTAHGGQRRCELSGRDSLASHGIGGSRCALARTKQLTPPGSDHRGEVDRPDTEGVLEFPHGDDALEGLRHHDLESGPRGCSCGHAGSHQTEDRNHRSEAGDRFHHRGQHLGDGVDGLGQRLTRDGQEGLERVGEVLEFVGSRLVDRLGLLLKLAALGVFDVGAVHGLGQHVVVVAETAEGVDVSNSTDPDLAQHVAERLSALSSVGETLHEGEEELVAVRLVQLDQLLLGEAGDLAQLVERIPSLLHSITKLAEDTGERASRKLGTHTEGRHGGCEAGCCLRGQAEDVRGRSDGLVDPQNLLIGGCGRSSERQDGRSQVFHLRNGHILHLGDASQQQSGFVGRYAGRDGESDHRIGEVAQFVGRNTDLSTELADPGHFLEADRGSLGDFPEPIEQSGRFCLSFPDYTGHLSECLLLCDGCGRRSSRDGGQHGEDSLETLLQLAHGGPQGEGGVAEVGEGPVSGVRCGGSAALSSREGLCLLREPLLALRKTLFGQREALLALCQPCSGLFRLPLRRCLLVLELNRLLLDARHLLERRRIGVDRAGELLVEPQLPLLGLSVLLRQPGYLAKAARQRFEGGVEPLLVGRGPVVTLCEPVDRTRVGVYHRGELLVEVEGGHQRIGSTLVGPLHLRECGLEAPDRRSERPTGGRGLRSSPSKPAQVYIDPRSGVELRHFLLASLMYDSNLLGRGSSSNTLNALT